MSLEKIVYMANQIATFFETAAEDAGAAGVANHINAYWEPRMRRQLFEVLDTGGAGLRPLVIAAAPRIRRPAEAAPA
jgi:formate dehydrogenase subunit delta